LPACFVRTGWWTIRLRWPLGPTPAARTFAERFRRVARDLGHGTTVFFRIGRYVEFRGPTLRPALERLGLRRIVLPRGGWRYAAGFPIDLVGRFLARAVNGGMIVALAPEGGTVTAVVCRRVLLRAVSVAPARPSATSPNARRFPRFYQVHLGERHFESAAATVLPFRRFCTDLNLR
jgi:hypothetical protein